MSSSKVVLITVGATVSVISLIEYGYVLLESKIREKLIGF